MGYNIIMRSLLLILVFALVNSQARTLTEESHGLMKDNYGKKPKIPPPPPKSATPIEELSPLFAENSNNYGRPEHQPPPPKSSTPVIQMVTISRKPRPPPPAPRLPAPTHEVYGGGVVLAGATDLFLSS